VYSSAPCEPMIVSFCPSKDEEKVAKESLIESDLIFVNSVIFYLSSTIFWVEVLF
jgi:hypothetical protein